LAGSFQSSKSTLSFLSHAFIPSVGLLLTTGTEGSPWEGSIYCLVKRFPAYFAIRGFPRDRQRSCSVLD